MAQPRIDLDTVKKIDDIIERAGVVDKDKLTEWWKNHNLIYSLPVEVFDPGMSRSLCVEIAVRALQHQIIVFCLPKDANYDPDIPCEIEEHSDGGFVHNVDAMEMSRLKRLKRALIDVFCKPRKGQP